MDVHTEVNELLGAWALDACEDDEADTVESHLAVCDECSDQARRLRSAVSWLGVDRVAPAPTALREPALNAARTRRPPDLLATLTSGYAAEVALLEELLDGLAAPDWGRPDPRHADVGGVIAHLAGNDARLAADLGLVVTPPAGAGRGERADWARQASALVAELERGADLERPVRLAGAGDPPHRPLRDALVQRAFETWIHRGDVGDATGRPQPAPPPDRVRRIIGLAAELLPEALRARGVIRPGHSARLVLDGDGGGEWMVPLGPDGEAGPAAVTVTADAVGFVRLVGNRLTPAALAPAISGDRALATALLTVASTLGCD
jgi:uncharacterized protein (TIGR03083 family)